MAVPLNKLVGRYRERGLLIDTNLLLLLLIGSFDPTWIAKFKRTRVFTIEDFRALDVLSRQFSRIVVTPNILTEASNLLGERSRSLPPEFFASFPRFVQAMKERYVASAKATIEPCFAWLGLSDSALVHLGPKRHLVVTDDLDLYNELVRCKIDAINFNHLRPGFLNLT